VDPADTDCHVDTSNPLNEFRGPREFYLRARPDYAGNFTVPFLWDKEKNTIVNNKPLEIMRMLNAEFNELATAPSLDLYPPALREEIDATNKQIETLNDAVYSGGFTDSSSLYGRMVDRVFEIMDVFEEKLKKQRYLVGNTLTESDVQLFTSLIRFDPVYFGLFKFNKRQLKDYPALYGYVRDLYNHKGIGETTNFGHIKFHYYRSFRRLNPHGVVPKGPILDLAYNHERDSLGN